MQFYVKIFRTCTLIYVFLPFHFFDLENVLLYKILKIKMPTYFFDNVTT